MARTFKLNLAVTILIMMSAFVLKSQEEAPRGIIGSGGLVMESNSEGVSMSGVVGQFAIESLTHGTDYLHQGFWVPLDKPVSVEDDNPMVNNRDLYNYPNPVSSHTTIKYELESTAYVTLTIYDMVGQVVAVLLNEELQDEGTRSIEWFTKTALGREVTSGSYVYELKVQPAQMAGGNSRPFIRRNVMVVVK